MIADRDLFVDSLGRLVDGDDPRAAILVAREGRPVPVRYVAVVEAGKPKRGRPAGGRKSVEPAADKSVVPRAAKGKRVSDDS